MNQEQKIVPFLWFDNNAEEAMSFYATVFPDFRITGEKRWGKDEPGPEGTLLTASFEIFGQEFTALNGGPQFSFTEAVSLLIKCYSQDEVDYYWNKLTADGGSESMCGWLKDKFGFSWQVTPVKMLDMLNDKDPAKAHRAMQAMMQMRKLDIGKLQAAYDGV